MNTPVKIILNYLEARSKGIRILDNSSESKIDSILNHIFLVDILILTLLWIGAIILVNPVGNFPLNDDWSYGNAVRGIIEGRTFRPSGWTGMTLFSQALWGSLFCLPFGFSFTALRFSTLSLACVGLLGTYVLLSLIRTPRWLAILGALLLAFNPIYFALSFTFMTDVPFTVFTILGLIFLIRRLQVESDLYLVIGTLMVTAAILCRQLGLFLPLAFAFVFFIQHGVSWRTFVQALGPLSIGVGALIGYENWLEVTNNLPEMYRAEIATLLDILREPKNLIQSLKRNVFKAVLSLGLYLFPGIIFCSTPCRKVIKSSTIPCRIVFSFF